MKLTYKINDNKAIIVIDGKIDTKREISEFECFMRNKFINSRKERFIIDMTNVPHIHSTALMPIIAMSDILKSKNNNLYLLNISNAVRSLLKTFHAETVFNLIAKLESI